MQNIYLSTADRTQARSYLRVWNILEPVCVYRVFVILNVSCQGENYHNYRQNRLLLLGASSPDMRRTNTTPVEGSLRTSMPTWCVWSILERVSVNRVLVILGKYRGRLKNVCIIVIRPTHRIKHRDQCETPVV